MNTVNTGTILVSKWGYEQTNVDFYMVKSITEKTCTVCQIGSTQISGDSWAGSVIPDPSKTQSGCIRRAIKEYKKEFCLELDKGYIRARVWNGEPVKFNCYG